MKITVITVAYNSGSTIADAIKSVASQKQVEVEHLIIDGASVDNTKEIIAENSSSSLFYFSEPDQGIYDAMNKGLLRSTGDVIGFLNADDFFVNENILKMVSDAFSDDESIDLVYGDLCYVDELDTDSVIRRWISSAYSNGCLQKGWMPPHPTVYCRRSVYERVGLFDLQYKIAADYDFLIRVFSKKSLKSRYIPHVMCKMRIGGASNKSAKAIFDKSKEDYKIIKTNRIGGIVVLLLKNLRKIPQFFYAKAFK